MQAEIINIIKLTTKKYMRLFSNKICLLQVAALLDDDVCDHDAGLNLICFIGKFRILIDLFWSTRLPDNNATNFPNKNIPS